MAISGYNILLQQKLFKLSFSLIFDKSSFILAIFSAVFLLLFKTVKNSDSLKLFKYFLNCSVFKVRFLSFMYLSRLLLPLIFSIESIFCMCLYQKMRCKNRKLFFQCQVLLCHYNLKQIIYLLFETFLQKY